MTESRNFQLFHFLHYANRFFSVQKFTLDKPKQSHFYENIENNSKIFQKGIDFMGNLRYNWRVLAHSTKQEV